MNAGNLKQICSSHLNFDCTFFMGFVLSFPYYGYMIITYIRGSGSCQIFSVQSLKGSNSTKFKILSHSQNCFFSWKQLLKIIKYWVHKRLPCTPSSITPGQMWVTPGPQSLSRMALWHKLPLKPWWWTHGLHIPTLYSHTEQIGRLGNLSREASLSSWKYFKAVCFRGGGTHKIYRCSRQNESKTGCANYLEAKKVGVQNFCFHYCSIFWSILSTILNSHHSSLPITIIYFPNWPIASLGENK